MKPSESFDFQRRPAHAGNRRIMPEPEAPPAFRWQSVWETLKGRWLVLGTSAALALALLLLVGWLWPRFVTFTGIEFTGTQYADLTELRKLVPYQDRALGLRDVDLGVVENAVKKHPWVASAEAYRTFAGQVEIRITEKTPQYLILNADGLTSYYVDAAGYPMPYVAGATFDVPLVDGQIPKITIGQKVPSQTLQTLAIELSGLDVETQALVSSLEMQSNGDLIGKTTVYSQTHAPATVLLGKYRFAERLRKLKAFWEQAVLPYPDKTIGVIDLRWDGQVVTRERSE